MTTPNKCSGQSRQDCTWPSENAKTQSLDRETLLRDNFTTAEAGVFPKNGERSEVYQCTFKHQKDEKNE